MEESIYQAETEKEIITMPEENQYYYYENPDGQDYPYLGLWDVYDCGSYPGGCLCKNCEPSDK